jgi:hypothetical protein
VPIYQGGFQPCLVSKGERVACGVREERVAGPKPMALSPDPPDLHQPTY